MPIDASIYSQIQAPKIANPLDQYAQVQAIQGAQNQNRLADLMYGEKQREVAGDSALANLLAGGKNPQDVATGLAAQGYGKQSLAYTKAQQEAAKQAAEMDSKKVETAHKRMELMGQTLGFVKSNPTIENATMAVQHLQQNGVIDEAKAQTIMAQFQADPSPAGIAKFATQGYQAALSAKDQLPKFETRNTGGTTDTLAIDPVTGKVSVANTVRNTQSPDSIASNATAMRGQNMVDARSRESTAQGKVPSGYRQNADGSLAFIPGGPADPEAAKKAAPTEFQGKSALFGSRAQEADKIIAGLTGSFSPAMVNIKQGAASTPLIGGALEAGVNTVTSQNNQKAEQAQRDFMNAILRQESGAAIGVSEFDNGKRQYFPQPGDGPEVIKQKANNRRLAVEGILNNGGRAVPKGGFPAASGASGSFEQPSGMPAGFKVIR